MCGYIIRETEETKWWWIRKHSSVGISLYTLKWFHSIYNSIFTIFYIPSQGFISSGNSKQKQDRRILNTTTWTLLLLINDIKSLVYTSVQHFTNLHTQDTISFFYITIIKISFYKICIDILCCTSLFIIANIIA